MKKIVVAVAALVFFMAYAPPAFCAQPVKPAQPAKPVTGVMKGQAVPDFSLKDTQGKQISLSSAKNKVVCLLFWATWCPYCTRELPRLKELNAKFADKGLVILSINIAANDPLPRVEAYQVKNQLPYTVLYDAVQEVSRRFYVTGIPVSIIIDRKGIIQYRGYQLPENVEQLVSQLL